MKTYGKMTGHEIDNGKVNPGQDSPGFFIRTQQKGESLAVNRGFCRRFVYEGWPASDKMWLSPAKLKNRLSVRIVISKV